MEIKMLSAPGDEHLHFRCVTCDKDVRVEFITSETLIPVMLFICESCGKHARRKVHPGRFVEVGSV